MKLFKLVNLILFFSFNVSNAHSKTNDPFVTLRKQYEEFKKNDERAMPFVNQYILMAKGQTDAKHLSQGYKDAIYYSSDKRVKLMYADSTVSAALRTKDNDLISNAYLGKGIIYYFNYKKFEPALNEYLKAYEYVKHSDDQYQIHKIKYHLGVVKSYLGFYEEALELFNDCSHYFEAQLKIDKHPNLKYNDEKGYLNTLHQKIVCLRNLNQHKMADSLITLGLHRVNNRKAFVLEESYLLKCKGISEIKNHNYNGAEKALLEAMPAIVKAEDFAWEAVVYYYLGKSRLTMDDKRSYLYMEKVDSIFKKTNFLLPELRVCYEDLITYSHKRRDYSKELYYTKQLLKFDSIIAKDFSFLSSKIHRKYDKESLLQIKDGLEKKSRNRTIWAITFITITLVLASILYFKFRREKLIRGKYRKLQERFIELEQSTKAKDLVVVEDPHKKNVLTIDVRNSIAEKLYVFEEQKLYLQKGLKLNSLAKKLGTNTLYLSTYINETKSINFSQYLNHLRIGYITKLLYEERRFLNYTMDALAEECGMSSRQSFSDIFYEINGIRPKDFIKNRSQDLEKGL